MTICASVKVRDGLVIGTDSMTQVWMEDEAGNRGVIKTYSNARKLFCFGDRSIGIMTYGIGNIGPRSIQGLVRDFSLECEEVGVREVASSLYEFFNDLYRDQFGDADHPPALGFFVAGYSPAEPFPEEWEFRLPVDEEVNQVRSPDNFGASWRGVELPFTRLYKGFDPRVHKELRDQGAPEEIIQIVTKYESPVIYDGMPVQDAINFAVFILMTTIGMATFEAGPASCGGPLQVATILPDEGFRWIEEPTLTVRNS